MRLLTSCLVVITAVTLPFADALADTTKPKPPSRREAKQIEKQKQLRFEYDGRFARERGRFFYESNAVIGRPIAEVMREWGAPSRVVEDGLGGKIYAYDSILSLRHTRFRDLTVDADGRVVRYADGTRELGGAIVREKMVQMWDDTIPFPGKSAAEIAALLRAHAESRGYQLHYAPAHQVVYRDFKQFGTASECGADLYGKTRVTATPRDGALDFKIHVENFSTLFGARLMINANDDVASENDVPFHYLVVTPPADAPKAYPEAISDLKGNLANPVVAQRVKEHLAFYPDEILTLANQNLPAP